MLITASLVAADLPTQDDKHDDGIPLRTRARFAQALPSGALRSLFSNIGALERYLSSSPFLSQTPDSRHCRAARRPGKDPR